MVDCRSDPLLAALSNSIRFDDRDQSRIPSGLGSATAAAVSASRRANHCLCGFAWCSFGDTYYRDVPDVQRMRELLHLNDTVRVRQASEWNNRRSTLLIASSLSPFPPEAMARQPPAIHSR